MNMDLIVLLKLITLAIVLCPLVASIVIGLFNHRMNKIVAHSLAVLSIFVSFVLSGYIFYHLLSLEHHSVHLHLYDWAVLGKTPIEIGFLLDRLTALMMVVVTFVSLMVHIYTIGYMWEDPGYQRFFSYIAAFTFGMLMLVMSSNFLQLFFGWEAVGLMSYLLIGFWFERESAVFANLKAFIVNRIGDMGFILGIAAIYYYCGGLDYFFVFEKIPTLPEHARTIICLCLFVGAMGKSAQMPLHVWLPDSMEGPTPISALIHAATMVTAGVFMLARLSPLFESSMVALNVVLSIGALTCFFTGLLGIVQNDIKRIIAYSTLSQLGYMMVAMGASAYAVGIFHLTTHAFFKALLFLGAGSVILALHHEQNIWKMGNLRKYMPITYLTMAVGSLALMGFPFFSGFYSKDLIIEAVKDSHLPAGRIAYILVLISVFITALYTFRLFFVVFHGPERMTEAAKQHLHESSTVVTWPLILLAIPSLFIGGILIQPLLHDVLQMPVLRGPSEEVMQRLSEAFPGAIKMGLTGFYSPIFLLGLLGLFTAWLFYIKFPELPKKISRRLHLLYTILREKYGFDILYEQWIMPWVQRLGLFFWQKGDQMTIDGWAVMGSAHSVGKLAILGRKFQTGYLYHYVFTMILGFLLLIFWLMIF